MSSIDPMACTLDPIRGTDELALRPSTHPEDPDPMASDHQCQRLIKRLARFTLGTATPVTPAYVSK